MLPAIDIAVGIGSGAPYMAPTAAVTAAMTVVTASFENANIDLCSPDLLAQLFKIIPHIAFKCATPLLLVSSAA
jgi:hypothetical protein